MADLLPIDTGSPARAELTPAADIARLDVPLAQLASEIDERMRRLIAADQQYDLHRLCCDSANVLPDCQYVSYLPGPTGGQS